MKTLHCLEFVDDKMYFYPTEIFILKDFRIKANKTVLLELNRVLPSNIWWLRSTNHVKFSEDCIKFTGKQVLVKHGFESKTDRSWSGNTLTLW